MSSAEKLAALSAASSGERPSPVGNAKYRLGQKVVHVRFCSDSSTSPSKYKFNINPNTLSADFELWVCGNSRCYYLMPLAFMREIYDNPKTYVDRMHPEIRVVSVDSRNHTVTYASGGVGASLRSYFLATLL